MGVGEGPESGGSAADSKKKIDGGSERTNITLLLIGDGKNKFG